jgi:hypothetical protein
MIRPLPRFVIAKPLASGAMAFYFSVPTLYRRLGCGIPNEPLGTDYAIACGDDGGGGRAAALNALFDEWNTKRKGGTVEEAPLVRYGTVDWLFREYLRSEACRERVSDRTRPDYERIMLLVCNVTTKKGDKVGHRSIRSITPRAADKIYSIVINGPRGPRLRQGEKVISVCRHAWRVVHRLYPDLFDKAVPNPWEGVTKKRRTLATKPAATREQVYKFAWGAINAGCPEPAAAAVICFEWLQRPENVVGGYLTWPDYRPADQSNAVRIVHHKTGAVVWHPLEETTPDGPVRFYTDAEAVLCPPAPARRTDDPESRQGWPRGAILNHGHGQASQAPAARPRPPCNVHSRCLPPRGHDRAGSSGANGRTRPRPFRPPDAAGL